LDIAASAPSLRLMRRKRIATTARAGMAKDETTVSLSWILR
jgi:hypothetical protein